ncbi:hypothetical protein C8E95_6089 [Pseudonocardia autotrophica]|uniref:Uncharacterized protein n=2 Tax=Pseudonocardia TaxID=1847 RepID=A0A1Y2MPH1_PSEAH|nr:hypothetical protein BG845_05152 [Pseudonocardia autotrophica]TDN76869.1 hypothetical protein C8E95_6089 [Pseudonocardia autotrophica]
MAIGLVLGLLHRPALSGGPGRCTGPGCDVAAIDHPPEPAGRSSKTIVLFSR